MFGLSFSELLMVLLVAMVVLGPKELPKYLRKAGQWAGQARRLAYDLRQKSGIDEMLRAEGLDRDIAELRKLTRGELTGVMAATRAAVNGVPSHVNPVRNAGLPEPALASLAPPAPPDDPVMVNREHEWPRDGADSYGAMPETAPVYEGLLAPSELASDPLYTRGEETTEAVEGTPQ